MCVTVFDCHIIGSTLEPSSRNSVLAPVLLHYNFVEMSFSNVSQKSNCSAVTLYIDPKMSLGDFQGPATATDM